MKKLQKYFPAIIFISAIVVGMFFRFHQLGKTPIGFYVDEAALGYNAFSILKTGKDEFGKYMPIMFRSFATFQSPVYTYLIVPLLFFVDLSPFSTRFSSAIFGLLTLPILYLLVKKLSSEKYGSKLALVSTLFLAISPWHIQYSRTAYESNVALFFLLLGAWLFFVSIKKPWYFLLSSLSFVASFYAYRAEILIVPVLVATLLVGLKNQIFPHFQRYLFPIIVSGLLGIILITPMVLILRTPGFQARTTTMNIFSYTLQSPWGYLENTNNYFPTVLNSPVLLSAKEFISLYTSYFSPRYLFSLGDSGPRKAFPDLGTFFAWQFPIYLLGIYFLLKEKDLKNLRYFVFCLLLVSPIPAALTRDPYSTLRALPMVIPLVIIMSLGLVRLTEVSWSVFNKSKYLLTALLLVYSLAKMYISIFYHHDYYRSAVWNYGWQEITESFDDLDQDLPVVVDNSRGDTYIELLFHLKYDPATYQKDNFEVFPNEYYTNMSRNTTKQIGRFKVKNFQWGVDTDHIDQYIIADNVAIGAVQIQEHNLLIIKEVRFPNGDVAMRILRTNPKK